MARTAKISNEQVIDATARLAARAGPSNVTVAAIADELAAPTGSIYHRFASRDQILAELWLGIVERFQSEFLALIDFNDVRSSGLQAALFVPRFVRRDLQSARLLLLHRREDFLSNAASEAIRTRALAIKSQMTKGLTEFSRACFQRTDASALRLTKFVLVDAPMAAVLPHLRADESLPRIIEPLIETNYRAMLRAADSLLARRS